MGGGKWVWAYNTAGIGVGEMIECVVGSEMVDGESGLPHLAHAVGCLIFLMWFDGREK